MIPNPWVIIGAVGIWLGSILGGYFYGTHHEALVWKAATAELQTTAEHKLREANELASKKDAALALLARNLDEQHAQALQDIESTQSDFARRLSDSVRLSQRGKSCSSQLPRPANAPGVSENVTSGSDGGCGYINTEAVQQVRDLAKRLQEDAKASRIWAAGVGL